MKSKFYKTENVDSIGFRDKVISILNDVFPNADVVSSLFIGDLVAIGEKVKQADDQEYYDLPHLCFEWIDEDEDESQRMAIDSMLNHVKRLHSPEKIVFRFAGTEYNDEKELYKTIIRICMAYKI